MDFERIPNKKLKKTAVPDITADWLEIVMFALTFNGYEAFPNDGCSELANKVSDEFDKVPAILEGMTLTELRACLFFEQRRQHHIGDDPWPNDLIYIGALLDAIRASQL